MFTQVTTGDMHVGENHKHKHTKQLACPSPNQVAGVCKIQETDLEDWSHAPRHQRGFSLRDDISELPPQPVVPHSEIMASIPKAPANLSASTFGQSQFQDKMNVAQDHYGSPSAPEGVPVRPAFGVR